MKRTPHRPPRRAALDLAREWQSPAGPHGTPHLALTTPAPDAADAGDATLPANNHEGFKQ